MATVQPTMRLHLPNLSIKNFRGIDELSISSLGRVTLFAGKNSVGKTTVLNAIEVYAARGRSVDLQKLLRKREEFVSATDEDLSGTLDVDWKALFYERKAYGNIVIGPSDSEAQLKIEAISLNDKQRSFLERFLPAGLSGGSWQGLRSVFGDQEHIIPWINASVFKEGGYQLTSQQIQRLLQEDELLPRMRCVSLETGLPDDRALTRYWNKVVLTPDEELAVQAMGLIFPDKVERVAVVGDNSIRLQDEIRSGRWKDRILVKLRGQVQPVPLKSLGDGALRLFSLALALANSQDGFLLIDESENGIHHSLQKDFWTLILQTAQANNVQVLATTHSVDCVRNFAYAADDHKDIKARLIRLDRDEFGLHAVEYSEENLLIAAEQGIEVR